MNELFVPKPITVDADDHSGNDVRVSAAKKAGAASKLGRCPNLGYALDSVGASSSPSTAAAATTFGTYAPTERAK